MKFASELTELAKMLMPEPEPDRPDSPAPTKRWLGSITECSYCGRPFVQKARGRPAKFCSYQCRDRHRDQQWCWYVGSHGARWRSTPSARRRDERMRQRAKELGVNVWDLSWDRETKTWIPPEAIDCCGCGQSLTWEEQQQQVASAIQDYGVTSPEVWSMVCCQKCITEILGRRQSEGKSHDDDDTG